MSPMAPAGRSANLTSASKPIASRRSESLALHAARPWPKAPAWYSPTGFIDPHNHSSSLDLDTAFASQVSQGITTLVVGQDGSSPLPIVSYIEARRKNPPTVNFQVLAGHATIRRKAMGDGAAARPWPMRSTPGESLLDQAMREGAAGLSSRLEYEAGSYAKAEEWIGLARVAGRHGGIYVSHLRDEGGLALESIREIVRIGREAGPALRITHVKLRAARDFEEA